MIVMSLEVQDMLKKGVIISVTYRNRYDTVTIRNTSSGLIAVGVGVVTRYFYSSLEEASDMLYSVGVIVQRI